MDIYQNKGTLTLSGIRTHHYFTIYFNVIVDIAKRQMLYYTILTVSGINIVR